MISKEKYDALYKAMIRERKSRKEAERIIEEKSAEIFFVNEKLKKVNQDLEIRIEERTKDIEDSRQKLIVAKRIAEEATKAKSDFLSSMTHELRTPLNGVIGLTDLILDEDVNDKVKDMLSNIKFSATHLADVINEILDFSKIEAGKITFEKVQFNLPDILKVLYKNLSITAKQKGLKLFLDIDDEVPELLQGDVVKLNQIINNLVGNALKFTEKGHVKVSCGLESKNRKDNRVTVYFEIQDTGIGIKKEKLESVFDSFTQSDSSIGRTYGGTGLGLTITKNFIELQGGKIGVTSTYGKGSTFYFSLPLVFISQKESRKKETKQRVYEALDLKVLVADDMAINQLVVGQILQKWGVEVDLVSSGQEALSLLDKHEYDLVLMDMQMPEMSGCDATRIIRTDSRFQAVKDIPVIAFTANAFENSKREVYEAGMNGFVTKPVNPIHLYETLSNFRKSS